jgi:hypothetical protein
MLWVMEADAIDVKLDSKYKDTIHIVIPYLVPGKGSELFISVYQLITSHST